EEFEQLKRMAPGRRLKVALPGPITFAGFLPPRHGQRVKRIKEISTVPATLVIYEAPGRVAEALADLSAVLGSRPAAIARELTKRFEEVRRGTLAELAAGAADEPPQGEVVLVIAPPVAVEIGDEAIDAALRVKLADSSLRDAADAVAAELGVARRRAYEIGLAIKRSRRD
ncbi:MAG TPA: SAM-dependent methyltransferase, partial [Hyphomicrobiaceae bacterium]|nr:SAM-dependent methyltransferase [Hyphomicrobiaceae bacterium]